MMRFLQTATALAALLVQGLPAPAQANCLAPREARVLVLKREVIPLVEAARIARDQVEGEMIDGRLCNDGADYVYVVTFLDPDGRVQRVTMDARNGTVLSIQ